MPMRFQSLDLNMGDNYVDKHRLPLSCYRVALLIALNNLPLKYTGYPFGLAIRQKFPSFAPYAPIQNKGHGVAVKVRK